MSSTKYPAVCLLPTSEVGGERHPQEMHSVLSEAAEGQRPKTHSGIPARWKVTHLKESLLTLSDRCLELRNAIKYILTVRDTFTK